MEFHHDATLYNTCNYLSMLWLRLTHDSKRGPLKSLAAELDNTTNKLFALLHIYQISNENHMYPISQTFILKSMIYEMCKTKLVKHSYKNSLKPRTYLVCYWLTIWYLKAGTKINYFRNDKNILHHSPIQCKTLVRRTNLSSFKTKLRLAECKESMQEGSRPSQLPTQLYPSPWGVEG